MSVMGFLSAMLQATQAKKAISYHPALHILQSSNQKVSIAADMSDSVK